MPTQHHRSQPEHNSRQSGTDLAPVTFGPPGFEATLRVDPDHDTIWASQQQIGLAFDLDHSTVSRHLAAIFAKGELDKDTVCALFAHTAADGKSYSVAHYNLDAIIAVGYRAGGPKATEFRKWSTGILKSYLSDGFVINERVLRGRPEALEDLYHDIQRLRDTERDDHKYILGLIRAVAVDFDEGHPAYANYAAWFQDRMHYAATGKTAAGIKLERADGTLRDMGMTNKQNFIPSRKHAQIAKNYLTADELRTLSMLADMFGVWVARRVKLGERRTMSEMFSRFDMMIQSHELPVFPGYKEKRAAHHADRHVDEQLEVYRREGSMIEVRERWAGLVTWD